MKDAPLVQRLHPTHVRTNGRDTNYFSGCDYFGLSRHPALSKAVRTGLDRYGLSVSASRVTTGNHPLYTRLEAQLARFFGSGAAILLPSGYLANLVVAQGVVGGFALAFIDER